MVYTQWKYRVRIIVDNPVNIVDYQINVIIPYRVHMNSDFSDIRFSDINGNELSYWIESYTSFVSATIWVKCPTNCCEFYLYYGNPAATTTSNGTNTFEFFDDFNDGSIATMWSSAGSVWTESNGTMNFSGASEGGLYLTVPSSNYIVEAKIRPNSWTSYRHNGLLARYNGQTGANGTGHVFTVQYDDVTKVNTLDIQVGWGTAVPSGFTETLNIWYNFKMAVLLSGNTEIKGKAWVVNGTEPTSWQKESTLSSRSEKNVGLFGVTSNGVSFDDFRVRKYSLIEPISTISQTNINPFHRRFYSPLIPIDTKLYNIDILFKKLNTNNNYNIDNLIKKLNANNNYNIDLYITRDWWQYNIDYIISRNVIFKPIIKYKNLDKIKVKGYEN